MYRLVLIVFATTFFKALAHYNRKNTNYNCFYNCHGNDNFNSFIYGQCMMIFFRKMFAVLVVSV